jgi:DNA-binding PadR family transcriptional regulator
MAADDIRRSPLAVVVLSFLIERPMHAYLMFQLMQQREKGSIVNIAQRNSLYQTLNRLVKSGLAEVDSTGRSDNRPERTVYRITDAGRESTHAWLREILSSAKPEFPEFPVGLSLLPLLTPQEIELALSARLARMEASLAEIEASLARAAAMQLPALFVVDEDYRRAILAAQVEWLRGLLAQLQDGSLTWSEEWIASVAAKFEQF